MKDTLSERSISMSRELELAPLKIWDKEYWLQELGWAKNEGLMTEFRQCLLKLRQCTFGRGRASRINLSKDFAKHSFAFWISDRETGQQLMNGGFIFFNAGDNGMSQMSITLSPPTRSTWRIHT